MSKPHHPHGSQPAWSQRDIRRAFAIGLAVVLAGSGFIVAIAGAYWLYGETAPSPIRETAFGAGAVLVIALVLAVSLIANPLHTEGEPESPKPQRDKPKPEQPAETAPASTESLWEQQAGYIGDISKLATCEHLQPIERAMRDDDIDIRLRYGHYVEATCRIDEARLSQHFTLAEPVFYSDEVPGETALDPPNAMIACREHGSCIWVVHPDDALPRTPRFPR